MYDGLSNSIENLYRLSNARTRSICAENPTGEKGGGARCELENGIARHAARDLGKGWKVNPYIRLQPHETVVLGEVAESGCINHIWCTPSGNWRFQILRIYWDGSDVPSVECPLGDFFACG